MRVREPEWTMPRVRVRDVVAAVNGAAFLMLASGRLLREVRRWRQERRRGRDRYEGQGRRRRRRPAWRFGTGEHGTGEQRMGTVTLYRPVGQKEFERVRESGFSAFPPRLPEQPLFYPVLNEAYATQIARDWNTKDAFSGYAGYVLRFAVRADFLAHYPVRTVGASEHQEYWVPAEDLPAFNAALVGRIEVIARFGTGVELSTPVEE
ncbi:MAG: hypothetical protein SFU56_19680 [Capsulimonadales bacterium]|nr:hypothetical protein [Capsulimonadales bacterium]